MKLYDFTGADFMLAHHVDANGATHALTANELPIFYWPDDRPCFPVNAFMLGLLRSGMSRRNRGGTLFTYGAHVSHLIRFCYNNQTDFIDLTDNEFTLFIRGLQVSPNSISGLGHHRTQRHVVSIGKTCLKFLQSVGELYGEENFVGKDGCIRAELRKSQFQNGTRSSVNRTTTSWHHHSFPPESPLKQRLPVSKAAIDGLRSIVGESSSSSFVRKRRLAMLLLLEITGGRRAEIGELRVESVREAVKMDAPSLQLITVKGRGSRKDRVRSVPVSHQDLHFLIEYIDKNRRPVIRKTCGLQADDGVLLVNETTGHGLKPNTISQEIYTLLGLSGIPTRVCAHMFRHRFLTKACKTLIERHQLSTADEFRRMLLTAEDVEATLLELSGHSSVDSLKRYIHLSFEEFRKEAALVDRAPMDDTLEKCAGNLDALKRELATGASPTEVISELSSLIESLRRDLSRGDPL
jgi:site-specific recombinase XerC